MTYGVTKGTKVLKCYNPTTGEAAIEIVLERDYNFSQAEVVLRSRAVSIFERGDFKISVSNRKLYKDATGRPF